MLHWSLSTNYRIGWHLCPGLSFNLTQTYPLTLPVFYEQHKSLNRAGKGQDEKLKSPSHSRQVEGSGFRVLRPWFWAGLSNPGI